MSIAMERHDYLQQIDCFVCNQQEAGLLFSDDYEHPHPQPDGSRYWRNVHSANMTSMVVTVGGQGAARQAHRRECAASYPPEVDVIDTTGRRRLLAGTVVF